MRVRVCVCAHICKLVCVGVPTYVYMHMYWHMCMIVGVHLGTGVYVHVCRNSVGAQC